MNGIDAKGHLLNLASDRSSVTVEEGMRGQRRDGVAYPGPDIEAASKASAPDGAVVAGGEDASRVVPADADTAGGVLEACCAESREAQGYAQERGQAGAGHTRPQARIVDVACGTPAYDAGFSPGCILTSVNGQPIRDIIDWRWLSSGDEVEVGYIDLDGESGEVMLWREPGEEWGFEFDGLVFDGVRQCRNACTFCFMHQLPGGMRRSLYLRDDDFRLSFLVGTFVTCTNMTAADEARIVEQRISPLRVSLQAANRDVRRRLIGKHAQHGLDVFDRLLGAGIEAHAQIVLVPGQNDGAILVDTLRWAYERPGILAVGIVPLGYTRHQSRFTSSFDSSAASRELLGLIDPFQERALRERGNAWVFAADEFYRNAWPQDVVGNLPQASFYGDFSMFEDGIGIIRSTVDDWQVAQDSGAIAAAADGLACAGVTARMVAGYAQREFLDALVGQSGIGDVFRPLYVANDFFGGNVDVTGLLTGQDIVKALRYASDSGMRADPVRRSTGASERGASCDGPRQDASLRRNLFLVPRVIFNDSGLTLDDMTLMDMERQAGVPLHMVSCSPLDYFNEIYTLARGLDTGTR